MRLMVASADRSDARSRRAQRKAERSAAAAVDRGELERGRLVARQAVSLKHQSQRQFKFARRLEQLSVTVDEAAETGRIVENVGELLCALDAVRPDAERVAEIDARLLDASCDTGAARDAMGDAVAAAQGTAGMDAARIEAEADAFLDQLCAQKAMASDPAGILLPMAPSGSRDRSARRA
ncbi:Hypothetical Protein FCC1311_114272 [Hondaea fermentalgiana]|uniref:Uncharacterized protein n=1 Tax=Hondaea fermentalgiana TaxID=2315210 RepID=A0A2R5H427_9STRA|nr:Hypothetical Protein FCC1311_114272 [Hondaea fermentalgiana]|eukprot:GBG35204.1 Hypothetical Protein FCC1311_114272 [Hondaea fermentalgiana]